MLNIRSTSNAVEICSFATYTGVNLEIAFNFYINKIRGGAEKIGKKCEKIYTH